MNRTRTAGRRCPHVFPSQMQKPSISSLAETDADAFLLNSESNVSKDVPVPEDAASEFTLMGLKVPKSKESSEFLQDCVEKLAETSLDSADLKSSNPVETHDELPVRSPTELLEFPPLDTAEQLDALKDIASSLAMPPVQPEVEQDGVSVQVAAFDTDAAVDTHASALASKEVLEAASALVGAKELDVVITEAVQNDASVIGEEATLVEDSKAALGLKAPASPVSDNHMTAGDAVSERDELEVSELQNGSFGDLDESFASAAKSVDATNALQTEALEDAKEPTDENADKHVAPAEHHSLLGSAVSNIFNAVFGTHSTHQDDQQAFLPKEVEQEAVQESEPIVQSTDDDETKESVATSHEAKLPEADVLDAAANANEEAVTESKEADVDTPAVESQQAAKSKLESENVEVEQVIEDDAPATVEERATVVEADEPVGEDAIERAQVDVENAVEQAEHDAELAEKVIEQAAEHAELDIELAAEQAEYEAELAAEQAELELEVDAEKEPFLAEDKAVVTGLEEEDAVTQADASEIEAKQAELETEDSLRQDELAAEDAQVHETFEAEDAAPVAEDAVAIETSAPKEAVKAEANAESISVDQDLESSVVDHPEAVVIEDAKQVDAQARGETYATDMDDCILSYSAQDAAAIEDASSVTSEEQAEDALAVKVAAPFTSEEQVEDALAVEDATDSHKDSVALEKNVEVIAIESAVEGVAAGTSLKDIPELDEKIMELPPDFVVGKLHEDVNLDAPKSGVEHAGEALTIEQLIDKEAEDLAKAIEEQLGERDLDLEASQQAKRHEDELTIEQLIDKEAEDLAIAIEEQLGERDLDLEVSQQVKHHEEDVMLTADRHEEEVVLDAAPEDAGEALVEAIEEQLEQVHVTESEALPVAESKEEPITPEASTDDTPIDDFVDAIKDQLAEPNAQLELEQDETKQIADAEDIVVEKDVESASEPLIEHHEEEVVLDEAEDAGDVLAQAIEEQLAEHIEEEVFDGPESAHVVAQVLEEKSTEVASEHVPSNENVAATEAVINESQDGKQAEAPVYSQTVAEAEIEQEPVANVPQEQEPEIASGPVEAVTEVPQEQEPETVLESVEAVAESSQEKEIEASQESHAAALSESEKLVEDDETDTVIESADEVLPPTEEPVLPQVASPALGLFNEESPEVEQDAVALVGENSVLADSTKPQDRHVVFAEKAEIIAHEDVEVAQSSPILRYGEDEIDAVTENFDAVVEEKADVAPSGESEMLPSCETIPEESEQAPAEAAVEQVAAAESVVEDANQPVEASIEAAAIDESASQDVIPESPAMEAAHEEASTTEPEAKHETLEEEDPTVEAATVDATVDAADADKPADVAGVADDDEHENVKPVEQVQEPKKYLATTAPVESELSQKPSMYSRLLGGALHFVGLDSQVHETSETVAVDATESKPESVESHEQVHIPDAPTAAVSELPVPIDVTQEVALEREESSRGQTINVYSQMLGKAKDLVTDSSSNEIVEPLESDVQQTLCLIKPDAYGNGHKDEIIASIHEKGFDVVQEKELQMTIEIAQEFYKEHKGKPFYEKLTTWMSSAPIYAIVLQKKDGIAAWRELAGPTNSEKAREIAPSSIRARFGTDGSMNAVHGSDSPVSAEREIALIFGQAESSAEDVAPIESQGDVVANESKTEIEPEQAVESVQAEADQEDFVLVENAEIFEMEDIQAVEKLESLDQAPAQVEESAVEEEQPIVEDLKQVDGQPTVQAAQEVEEPVVEAAEEADDQPVVEAAEEADEQLIFETAQDVKQPAVESAKAVDEQLTVESAPEADEHPVVEAAREPAVAAAAEEADDQPTVETAKDAGEEPAVEIAQENDETPEHLPIEQTLCLIKPDAFGSGNKDAIVEQILQNGFTVVREKQFQMTLAQAQTFYREHEGKAFYDRLTSWMSRYIV